MLLVYTPRRRLRQKTAAMVPAVEAESSGGEEESEAEYTSRGRCGQFVWPCPRKYPFDATAREAQKWRIPADMTKEAFGKLFKGVGGDARPGAQLCTHTQVVHVCMVSNHRKIEHHGCD